MSGGRAIPVTVLAWEGPQARAYLVRMARAGLRPERVVVMVRDAVAERLADVPGAVEVARRYGARAQDRSHNHHPYRIRRAHPELVRSATAALEPLVPDAATIVDAMYRGFRWEAYADTVEYVIADSYRSARLHRKLEAIAPATVVFTGGGIVPKAVFGIDGLTLVHVHTGLLPYVRGADVLLWSLLVRGRPGVSAFVMSPGLDDGDVLATWETDPLVIDVPSGARPDDDTLYRAVFSFVDPLLRAELLVREVLAADRDLRHLRGEPQDLTTGVTFHFMHPIVRSRALEALFRSPRAEAPAATSTTPMLERYAGYYERSSPVAPLRFALDAVRTRESLRALGIRNRQRDYAALAGRPDRLALHRELHAQLLAQSREWPTYDYGEGYWYQSSDELGVTGLRDTTGRVEAFGLRDLVRDRTVLEIGSNSGFLSLAVAPAARRVVAFEINPFLVEAGRIGARYLGVDNVEFSVSSFEDFDPGEERYDDVLSFANHHTYDGNTRQGLEDYFRRCHEVLRPGGRLLFESHPPALEGRDFARTVEIIGQFFDVERSEVHRYGTFLDQDRRFLVGVRRDGA